VKLFSLDVVSDESVVMCELAGQVGNVELFMSWDGRFVRFDCQVEGDTTEKRSSIGPRSGTAYAIVYATAATADFQINCSVGT
jgi:hypothetical protein